MYVQAQGTTTTTNGENNVNNDKRMLDCYSQERNRKIETKKNNNNKCREKTQIKHTTFDNERAQINQKHE